ncbi:MAG: class I tRNA ligase family protein, partial [Candidatus Cloacimonetes bacterium]|nr:class I tRNA ligase family protein [Candidatus Cloacimonadota bacterium]
RLIEGNLDAIKRGLQCEADPQKLSPEMKKLLFSSHYCTKKWLEDCLDRMQYNTAIAAIMEHLNRCISVKDTASMDSDALAVYAEACGIIPQLLYPFAPHVAEELWQMMGFQSLLHESGLPGYEDEYLVQDTITLVIQVNGKIRGKLEVAPDTAPEILKTEALQVDNVIRALEGFEVVKTIVVPGKMISIAAKPAK